MARPPGVRPFPGLHPPQAVSGAVPAASTHLNRPDPVPCSTPPPRQPAAWRPDSSSLDLPPAAILAAGVAAQGAHDRFEKKTAQATYDPPRLTAALPPMEQNHRPIRSPPGRLCSAGVRGADERPQPMRQPGFAGEHAESFLRRVDMSARHASPPPLTDWFDLLHFAAATVRAAPPAPRIACWWLAIAVLVLLWLQVLARRPQPGGEYRGDGVWAIAGAWALPFVGSAHRC